MTPAVAAALDDTVWSEPNTTPAAIETALRRLLAERHAQSRLYVPARVLNMVCVVEQEWGGEIANRLRRVGRNHASRTIVCRISRDRTTIDAIASVAATANPAAGTLALTRETVIIDIGAAHVTRLDSILDPLVVTDLPTMVWAPHGHWEAVAALESLAQIVLLDSSTDPDVALALRRSGELLSRMAVVDLAWLRSAPWRERVAALFDSPARRETLAEICGLELRHHAESGSGALLLCGWLASRLGWAPARLELPGGGVARGSLEGPRGEVAISLEVVDQESPGLAGMTLEFRGGGSLKLDRGPGGLHAARRDADGTQHAWTLLGASRGEGGILGEGIRQSLVRDRVYGEALRATTGLLA